MDRNIDFPFISRLVALPPDLAAVVFDVAAADRRIGSADDGTWVLPSGRLQLQCSVGNLRPQRGYSPLRETRGILRQSGRQFALPVALELLPWTVKLTEPGLRVAPRRAPMTGLHDRPYRRLGHEAVDTFAAVMQEWPLSFLGGPREPLERLRAS
jgi:hypothetical protein